MIVDDDSSVRDMLGFILKSHDYSVEDAENGVLAYDKYAADPSIDLIISDMNMPEMNGLELIQALRKADYDVPVIILTGNNEISVAIEAMKNGASDYILKDENIQDTIIISIEKVMENFRLKLQNLQLMADLEKKNKELEQMVFIDGLTGIANRRYFNDISKQEWGRAIRDSQPFALIMIDIDYFKLYNDYYGHQDGDDCLRNVAQALDSALERSGDFVSRYGGEEFVAVLPNTNIEGAFVVAESICKKVADINIPHEKSEVGDRVTVSIGVGSVFPDRNSDCTELIAMVDEALYKAKREGRNRIVVVNCSI